jgi:hypothetical protein
MPSAHAQATQAAVREPQVRPTAGATRCARMLVMLALVFVAAVALIAPARAQIVASNELPVPLPSTDWTFCSLEFERCNFAGTREVRYGKDSTWTEPRQFADGVDCNNGVFGDPLFGVRKQCDTRPVGSTPPPPSDADGDGVQPLPSQPAAPGGAMFPPLPAGANLIRRDDFEDGTVGQSYESQQCHANNNRIANDPHGGGFGKVWESWWDPGDPSLLGHGTRCERSFYPRLDGAGTFLYRDVFSIPADSWVPDAAFTNTGYSQRIQFHGHEPSTSPPLDLMVRRDAVDQSRFQMRFMAGANYKFWTPWFGSFAKDAWHSVEVRVRWSRGSDGWTEFFVDGQPVTTMDGTTREQGVTLMLITGQGAPAKVYKKYGIDGTRHPAYVHHYHALSESYTL